MSAAMPCGRTMPVEDSPHCDKKIALPRTCVATQLCVLTDPVYRVRTDGEARRVSLPGLLSLLAEDNIEAIVGLRPHHAHSAHMFLAQLVSMLPIDTGCENDWRNALLALEPDERAWQVFPETGEMGFLQPAFDSNAKINTSVSPSDIDLLVLSRNHAVKYEPACTSEIDVWLWTLAAVQTGGGFPGRGSYGTFRINSGLGSRSLWAIYDRSWGIGRRILEDARLIRNVKPEVTTDFGFAREGGLKLMWTAPWDGVSMLRASDLDASVVEICRRINLATSAEGKITCKTATSDNPRTVLAKTGSEEFLRGNCGDIWSPILSDKIGSKAYSMDGRGLPYDIVAYHAIGMAFGGNISVRAAPAVRRNPENPVLVIAGIANGQGKTEGFYQREVTFRAEPDEDAIFDGPSRGDVAQKMVDEAKFLQSCLRRAVAVYIGSDVSDAIDERFVGAASSQIDQIFFEHLDAVYMSNGAEQGEWVRALHAVGKSVLNQAVDQIPVRAMTRARQSILAIDRFEFLFWNDKKFPFSAYRAN